MDDGSSPLRRSDLRHGVTTVGSLDEKDLDPDEMLDVSLHEENGDDIMVETCALLLTGTTTATPTTTAYERSRRLSAAALGGRGGGGEGGGPRRRGAFGSSSVATTSVADGSPPPSEFLSTNKNTTTTDEDDSPRDGPRLEDDIPGDGHGVNSFFDPAAIADPSSLRFDRDESDSDDHIDFGDGDDDDGMCEASSSTTTTTETARGDDGHDCHDPRALEADEPHEASGDDELCQLETSVDERDGGVSPPASPSPSTPSPPPIPEPVETTTPPPPPPPRGDFDDAPQSSWELSDVLEETGRLVRAVEDVASVTAKQIFQSLEGTFQFQMDKATKRSVKERMIAVLEELQSAKDREQDEEDARSEGEDTDEASDQGKDSDDDADSEDAPSDEDDDDSDEEYTSRKSRPKVAAASRAKGNRASKSKKPSSRKGDGASPRTTTAKERPSRRIKKDVRVKAMRIHAEALRKRRMEELRVRNEELQLECNEKDQKRAEEIAAKFDTNTEELRVRRLEQRVELLSRLDEKRIQVVEKERPVELEVSSSDSEDDSDDDLELEGPATLLAPHVHKPSGLSLLALADHKVCRHQLKKRVVKRSAASPSRSTNARAALKCSLAMKRRQQSNLWLARELGYKSEKEHLKECLEEGRKKQAAVRKLEQERLQRNQLMRERMLQGVETVEDGYADGEEEEAELALSDNDGGDGDGTTPREEDEEVAMARELEEAAVREHESGESQITPDFESESQPGTEEFPVLRDEAEGGAIEHNENAGSNLAEVSQRSHSESMSDPTTQIVPDIDVGATADAEDSLTIDLLGAVPEDSEEKRVDVVETDEALVEEPTKPKGPRNAAWKALLEKEAALVKKQKSKKNGWVEDEADEEEDEQVAGLEDFGFSIHKKKKDDEDENEDDLNDDDLEHVVDDLSDNEGDEDAGENARKAMEIREEKERHKEVLRRLRDGYDGRRGGVAGGLGARGVHRFDQLVAADNREDAKRLGLLNDDELESDDDEAGSTPTGADEEEDEGALIDKMLKDRFLHRSSVDIEEEFSDDEEEIESEDVEKENSDDIQEMEQERLAKRFAKRARMHRLLEAHGHEEEFSRSRLIDEDASLKMELSKMKNGLARKRTISSQTASSSNSEPGKKQKGAAFTAGLACGGSLAIALQASRRTNKSRTTFVRSTSTTIGTHANKDETTTTSFQRCISLSSVVFSASNSNTGFGAKKNALHASSVRLASRPVAFQRREAASLTGAPGKKPSSSESLWSRAIATGYKKVP